MKGHALVGHTGFVGSNLLRQRRFDFCVNRFNLDALDGACLERLVLSALPAEKWRINLEPEADLANLRRLQQGLLNVRAKQVVLISTVDVYNYPVAVDENTPVLLGKASPYGRHRFEFEQWANFHFESITVIRLPGLFGAGLKKNALFDLLHGHQVEKLHPQARLQWYPIDRLSDDIDRALDSGLRLVHAAVEPLFLQEVAAQHFPQYRLASTTATPAHYDMRSRYAGIFGGSDGYWMSSKAVLDEMGRWLDIERRALA